VATYTQRKEPPTLSDKLHRDAVREASQEADHSWPECRECGELFNPKRKALGYNTCLACGEPKKQFAVVPVPKSNYIVATSASQVASPYSHKGNR
jgi:ribosomal protein L37AE/L43A